MEALKDRLPERFRRPFAAWSGRTASGAAFLMIVESYGILMGRKRGNFDGFAEIISCG